MTLENEEKQYISSKTKAKQIKFLANSLGNGQNRAQRRAFASNIRKQLKGVKIDA